MRTKNIKRTSKLKRVVHVNGEEWSYKVGRSFCIIEAGEGFTAISRLVPLYELVGMTPADWENNRSRLAITPWHVQTYVEQLIERSKKLLPLSNM